MQRAARYIEVVLNRVQLNLRGTGGGLGATARRSLAASGYVAERAAALGELASDLLNLTLIYPNEAGLLVVSCSRNF